MSPAKEEVDEPHHDERQVSLDTDRSFVIYPEGMYLNPYASQAFLSVRQRRHYGKNKLSNLTSNPSSFKHCVVVQNYIISRSVSLRFFRLE